LERVELALRLTGISGAERANSVNSPAARIPLGSPDARKSAGACSRFQPGWGQRRLQAAGFHTLRAVEHQKKNEDEDDLPAS